MRSWLILLIVSLLAASPACAFSRGIPTPSPPTRLAYVGLDGQIYTVPLEGGDPRRVSVLPGEAPPQAAQRFARWPTWAPDGARLAFMRFDLSEVVDDKASIFVVEADGSGLTRLFESAEELPIYMAWAPDSSSLTLLTQRGQELRLQLIDPSGVKAPRELATGSPLYFAWSPDARRLLLHANGDHRSGDRAKLVLLQADAAEQLPDTLAAKPTDFRAPAWSADGSRMAFVVPAPGGQAALSVQNDAASEPTRLALVGAEPAFLWSPDAERLAFSSRVSEQVPLYSGVETIKADGSDRQRVTDTNVAAFYWSPDGRKLAYAGLDTNARALAWFVSDSDGKNRRQVASFVPSDEQFFMFRFFDQYAQSHAVWSPDGKYLVYAGTRPDASAKDGGGSAREGTAESTRVFVAAADGSSGPRTIVEGTIGLWPVPATGKK